MNARMLVSLAALLMASTPIRPETLLLPALAVSVPFPF